MQFRSSTDGPPWLAPVRALGQRFLAPPTFEDEAHTRLAALFDALLLAGLAVGALTFGLLAAFGGLTAGRAAFGLAAAAAVLALRAWLRRGPVRVVIGVALGAGALLSAWLGNAGEAYRTVGLGGLLLAGLIATLVLGARAGLVYTLFGLGLGLGLAGAPLASLTAAPPPLWALFGALALGMLVVGAIVHQALADGQRRAARERALRREAEAAHQLDQIRVNGILASAMDAIITVDDGQRIRMFNAAAEAMFRIPAVEVLGQPLDRFLPEPARDRHNAYLDRFGATGHSTRQMGRLGAVHAVRADGEAFPMEASISRVEFNGQRLYTVIARDLSEPRRAEAALEARYRAIVEDQTDLICRYRPDGTLTFVNPAYARYHGRSPEAWLGQRFEMRVHPQDQEIVARKRATLSPANPVATYWCRVLRPDGEIRWQEWTERVLYDETGAVSEYQAVGQDITERQMAVEATKRHNEELLALNTIATIIGQATDLETRLQAILTRTLEVLNADGGWVYLLEADETGAPALRLGAQAGPWRFLTRPPLSLTEAPLAEDALAASAMVQQALEAVRAELGADLDPEPWVTEGAALWAKDRALGVLGLIRGASSPFSDSERQLLSTLGRQVGVMIENARLSEQAAEFGILRELDRLRAELVANVSHELRTPLGLITLACTTLLREDVSLSRETQREFLHDIEEETIRLEKIVDNLLDLSRMQSGRMRLEKHPTEMRQLSEDTLAAMRPQFPQHQFVSDFPAAPIVAHVDARRIEQVLRNLLGNASKYSAPGTAVTIRGRRYEGTVLMAVSDQGVGIPAHDLEKVFERFYRVQRDRVPGEPETPGIGLGLAVCRGIVEAHEGHIWAESVVGAGSTFYFTLPVWANDGPNP